MAQEEEARAAMDPPERMAELAGLVTTVLGDLPARQASQAPRAVSVKPGCQAH